MDDHTLQLAGLPYGTHAGSARQGADEQGIVRQAFKSNSSYFGLLSALVVYCADLADSWHHFGLAIYQLAQQSLVRRSRRSNASWLNAPKRSRKINS
jgi:hypothetical protein